MKRVLLFLFAACLSLMSCAQKRHIKSTSNVIAPTESGLRIQNTAIKKTLLDESVVANIPIRCVGPTVMGGRVVDIEVCPYDPTHFFVAYASGGLWVTYNNGTSFTPLFDDQMVITIGDIAVDWNDSEMIWIGTGEVNSSRSSYSGTGVYCGTRSQYKDNGEPMTWTWENKGLNDTHHIGRVIVNPENSDVIYVAALGHLYSPNKERGVFKSIDRGNTWKQVLFVDENAGAVDLILDAYQPEQLFASIWHRSRKAWEFSECGEYSGIYQTEDGGSHWNEITRMEGANTKESTSVFNGAPRAMIGRIGLALFHNENANVLYAFVDNQDHRPENTTDKKEDGWKKDMFLKMTPQELLALDTTKLNEFLIDNGFPEEYTITKIHADVKAGIIKPIAFYDYLYDANEDLFNTPVVGGEVYRYHFDSSGWRRTHEDYLDDLVFTYGYYFGVIRVHPKNKEKLYIAGVPLLTSDDGGANWRGINPDNVHVDHHTIWIDPEDDGHIINGSDGGVQISYDDGSTFVNCNTPAVGQFYTVQVDNAEPYNVYGGLQDNGVWFGSSLNKPTREWYSNGRYPFKELLGGDGMQVMVDTRDNKTVYTGYQFGNYTRTSTDFSDEKSLHISHKLGEKPLRWNWQTPILLSKYNQDIFYICSNKVHRSLDKGENFKTLSGDLTKGEKPGDVPFGTLTAIAESPLQFGMLAVGSDDGLVHISKDNGYNWQAIQNGLPAGLWVSRIVFSSKIKERIYVTLNGYRDDHFNPYVFVSNDLGKTWESISEGLPLEPVNVLREDPTDESILYIGTDNGLYVTLNGGAKWMMFSAGLPNVAVHDMVIQERENELVIGTHGRSIWIAKLNTLRQLNKINLNEQHLMEISSVKKNGEWGGNWSKWLDPYLPECKIPIYSDAIRSDAKLECWLGDSLLLADIPTQLQKGLNFVTFDLSMDQTISEQLEAALNAKAESEKKKIKIKKSDNGKFYLPKGEYVMKFSSNGKVEKENLVID